MTILSRSTVAHSSHRYRLEMSQNNASSSRATTSGVGRTKTRIAEGKTTPLLPKPPDPTNLVCHTCGRTFTKTGSLVLHEKACRAGDNSRRKCNYCDKEFPTYPGLRQHERRRHPAQYNADLEAHLPPPDTQIFMTMAKIEASIPKGPFLREISAAVGLIEHQVRHRRRNPIYAEYLAQAKLELQQTQPIQKKPSAVNSATQRSVLDKTSASCSQPTTMDSTRSSRSRPVPAKSSSSQPGTRQELSSLSSRTLRSTAARTNKRLTVTPKASTASRIRPTSSQTTTPSNSTPQLPPTSNTTPPNGDNTPTAQQIQLDTSTPTGLWDTTSDPGESTTIQQDQPTAYPSPTSNNDKDQPTTVIYPEASPPDPAPYTASTPLVPRSTAMTITAHRPSMAHLTAPSHDHPPPDSEDPCQWPTSRLLKISHPISTRLSRRPMRGNYSLITSSVYARH